jgi:hypothetical protein
MIITWCDSGSKHIGSLQKAATRCLITCLPVEYMGRTKTLHTIVEPQYQQEDIAGNIDAFLSTLARWVAEDIQSTSESAAGTARLSKNIE